MDYKKLWVEFIKDLESDPKAKWDYGYTAKEMKERELKMAREGEDE